MFLHAGTCRTRSQEPAHTAGNGNGSSCPGDEPGADDNAGNSNARDANPDANTVAIAVAEPDARTEPEPDARTEPGTESESGADSDADPGSESEPESDAKPDSDSEPDAESHSESEPARIEETICFLCGGDSLITTNQ